MPNTPVFGYPYPALGDPANGPVALQNLALALEVTTVYHCTSATRPAHTDGRLIYETDTDRLYVSDGATWQFIWGKAMAFSIHMRSIAGAANFNKPANPPARLHIVECWGPGGGGGGCSGTTTGSAEGGGGGSGAYVRKVYLDSDLLAAEPYVVGAGGAGATGANGNSGSGATTFKGLSAGAGGGGSVMPNGTTDQGANMGSGGAAAGGDLNMNGSDGGKGRKQGSFCHLHNFGGPAPNGGGLAQLPTFGAGTGGAGRSPGGGGSGAFAGGTPQAGGTGADGKILVTSIY